MSDNTLFADTEQNLNLDQEKDYLAELVGDNKKFKTPQDLAKGKAESDLFIAQLLQEKQEMRDELKTRLKYEEFLTRLEQARRPVDDNQDVDDEPETTNTTAMRPEDIERLLDQRLAQRERQAAQQNNLNLVKARLSEALGPNFAQRLKEQASNLGVSEQYLNDMAAEQPKALFRLLGLDQEPHRVTSMSPPRSQMNTEHFTPSTRGKGKSYFDAIYERDKNEFFSAKVQNERFKAIEDMGMELFENS